jgi:hypothetical protein
MPPKPVGAPVAPPSLRTPQRAAAEQHITLAIPLDALGPITVTAPPPALVSSDLGAEHVGLTRAALVDHLAWMARHPRWGERVIVASRKRRLATPEDVIASLRERYAGRPKPLTTPTAADDVDAELAELWREFGIVEAPPDTRTTGPTTRPRSRRRGTP